jgi:hypothetical protein
MGIGEKKAGFISNIQMIATGFRYEFAFALAGASVRRSNKKYSLTEYARGSIISDRKTRYLSTNNRPNVGKGGISIIPYLDLNSNNHWDPGEPKVAGLNLRANAGRILC